MWLSGHVAWKRTWDGLGGLIKRLIANPSLQNTNNSPKFSVWILDIFLLYLWIDRMWLSVIVQKPHFSKKIQIPPSCCNVFNLYNRRWWSILSLKERSNPKPQKLFSSRPIRRVLIWSKRLSRIFGSLKISVVAY